MQVKTFKGSDTQAALARVKAELGDDAIILNTKSVRSGGGMTCEITAAVDPKARNGNGNGNGNGATPAASCPCTTPARPTGPASGGRSRII